MRMQLTYPKSYSSAELRAIYDEYRAQYPEVFQAWVEIEKRGRDIHHNDLLPTQKHLYNYLSQRADFENHLALSEVLLDFRKLIVKEFMGYDLVPGDD